MNKIERQVNQNDEPTETTASTARASRTKPTTLQRPDSRGDRTDTGIHSGQALETNEEEYNFPTKPGWRSEESLNCTICTFYGRPYSDIKNRKEWESHLRKLHGAWGTRDSGSGIQRDIKPCVTACIWICSVCREEYYYPTDGKSHGGPEVRSFDRRFGFAYCRQGKYPSHKRALGKIDGHRGPVLHYHSGMRVSEEQEQTDPSLVPFLSSKKERKPKSREHTSNKAGSIEGTRVQRASRKDRMG